MVNGDTVDKSDFLAVFQNSKSELVIKDVGIGCDASLITHSSEITDAPPTPILENV